MKLFKSFILLFIFVLGVIFISSCSATRPDMGDFSAGSESTPPNGETEEEPIIEPGQLTACAYNDNDHFNFWQSLLTSNQEEFGEFKSYYDQFAFKTYNRIKIIVPSNMDVIVNLVDEQNNVLFTAIPDANGVAYLYSKTNQSSYNICLEYKKPGDTLVSKQYEIVTGDTEFILTSSVVLEDNETTSPSNVFLI